MEDEQLYQKRRKVLTWKGSCTKTTKTQLSFQSCGWFHLVCTELSHTPTVKPFRKTPTLFKW